MPRKNEEDRRVSVGIRLEPHVKEYLQTWTDANDYKSLSTLISDICSEWVDRQQRRGKIKGLTSKRS